jgi:hypothetical protein
MSYLEMQKKRHGETVNTRTVHIYEHIDIAKRDNFISNVGVVLVETPDHQELVVEQAQVGTQDHQE